MLLHGVILSSSAPLMELLRTRESLSGIRYRGLVEVSREEMCSLWEQTTSHLQLRGQIY